MSFAMLSSCARIHERAFLLFMIQKKVMKRWQRDRERDRSDIEMCGERHGHGPGNLLNNH